MTSIQSTLSWADKKRMSSRRTTTKIATTTTITTATLDNNKLKLKNYYSNKNIIIDHG